MVTPVTREPPAKRLAHAITSPKASPSNTAKLGELPKRIRTPASRLLRTTERPRAVLDCAGPWRRCLARVTGARFCPCQLLRCDLGLLAPVCGWGEPWKSTPAGGGALAQRWAESERRAHCAPVARPGCRSALLSWTEAQREPRALRV